MDIIRDIRYDDFLAMLRRNEGCIFRLCMAFGHRRRELVADLYQEVAGRLWQAFDGFRGESSESTWVYRVALNTLLLQERHRRQGPPLVGLDDEMLDHLVDRADNELLDRLYELIDRLEPDEKALVMLYLDHVPEPEMARAIGRSVSATKKRMRKIKVKLKYMNENEE